MAIEQFDDGPDMQKEILMLLKKDNTKLKKSNNFLMKITNKMLNTFKIIFLISIIVYGSSRAYCGLAQHKISEYNAKINKVVNQLIKDDTIYNKAILNSTLDKIR